MEHKKKLTHLYSELPRWIELRKKDLDRATTESNWPPISIALAYFDLAHGKLANNEVNDAKRYFFEGARTLISGDSVRSDVGINVFGHGHQFSIYAYLGGNKELGKLFAKRHIIDFQIEMAKPGYLSPVERIFEDMYLLFDELILGNSDAILSLLESLDKRLLKFKISSETMYKKSGLYYKYPLFGKEIVRSIGIKNEIKFSENMFHWSQLMLNAISIHDTPNTLADIKLILLYDLALGNSMMPKIDIPFIPKSVIENGYWNKPL